MIGMSPIQADMAIAICVWLFLLTAMIVTAVLTKKDGGQRAKASTLAPALGVSDLWSPKPVVASEIALVRWFAANNRPGLGSWAWQKAGENVSVRPGFQANRPVSDSTRSLQGVLQRVDYINREIHMVGQGQAWHLMLDPKCQLRFDSMPASLRCFHPLDEVTVFFEKNGSRKTVSAVFSWEKQYA
jgi:hypothetical protein